MPDRSLIRICFGGSRRHPLRTLLMILGIALGVAGVIAIDIAKTSVSKSFDLSTRALTARATHQIVGSRFELPQDVFTELRTGLGVYRSAPIIATHVKVPRMDDRIFTLMGVDPFSERHFRDLKLRKGALDLTALTALTGNGPGVLIHPDAGLGVGDRFEIALGSRRTAVSVAGILDAGGGPDMMAGLLLTDIAAAQEILGMDDRITRIDLILENEAQAGLVRENLPPGVFLVATDRRNHAVRQLSASFETSLTAFSMLALFMGIFLIYNTVSFSVARRRKLNGTLRALGATRGDIFKTVMGEVLIYALAGSVLGLLLGVLMGHAAVRAVCATVSDMYYTLTVSQFHLAPETLVKGLFAGLGASFASALFPALNAANTRPVTLMQRSASESRLKRFLPWLFLAGLLVLLAAAILLGNGPAHTGFDFLGIFMIFFGASLTAPLLVRLGIRLFLKAGNGFWHVLTKMALRNIVRSLSRTSVLVASLMVVVSVYIGIEIMTTSFRQSIIDWVDGNIGGHIHVASADTLNRSLDPDYIRRVKDLPGIESVSAYNILPVFSRSSGRLHIFSYASDQSLKRWVWTAAPEPEVQQLLADGWIVVSEIFARQNGVAPGPDASALLQTNKGPRQFRVAGIFRDFFMGGGRIIVGRETMKQYWDTDDITALQLFLVPGTPVSPLIEKIRSLGARAPDNRMIRVQSGARIKQSILDVFDKTFIITSALQVLTAIVALTGILNAIMALLLERTREIGVLRACGAETRQVGRLLLMECFFCGLISGLMALPLGTTLAWVLVDIVNQRSFGWTYDLVLSPWVLIQAVLLSAVAALFAGIFPAMRAGRADIPTALITE